MHIQRSEAQQSETQCTRNTANLESGEWIAAQLRLPSQIAGKWLALHAVSQWA